MRSPNVVERPYKRLLLDALLDDAPVGFALLDTELRYILVNDTLAEVNGVSVADHIGRRLREVVPDLAPQAEAAFGQVLKTGEPIQNLEITGRVASTPDRERTWLESVYRVGDDDDILGCAVIVVEVTEERRAVADRDAFSRRLIRGLVPADAPTIPGASLVGHYAPARAADAGGDFWDCLRIGPLTHLLALGDTAGKGAPAAALMSVVRHSIRSMVRFEQRPSRLLAHLNSILLDRPLHEDPSLCTAAIMKVTSSTSRLRAVISLGGHPPPLVVRTDGSVDTVGAPGTILGVTRDAHHIDQAIEMRRGDALVMFTDGLIDQHGLDERVEYARLREVLQSTARASAEVMLSTMKSALLDGRDMGGDDIAVLVLRKD